MTTNNRQRIDLHHHIIAPELSSNLSSRGIDWTGGTGTPPWNMPLALETMERMGIAVAMASVQPHAYWPELGEVERWTRANNDFLARVVQDDPQHFGGLAALPQANAERALRELERAFDELRLDGVTLLTSEAGQYLGDPALDELFQELNRRSAVVVLHPTTTPPFSDQLKVVSPPSMVEMMFESTRAVANLLFSGTLHRYPAIRFVVPHAGGTIPYLATRLEAGAKFSAVLGAQVPLGPTHYLRRLYYDTAISTSGVNLAGLKQFVPSSQIVFGSDFPYIQGGLLDKITGELDRTPLFTEDERAAIDRGNALTLFPRFAPVTV